MPYKTNIIESIENEILSCEEYIINKKELIEENEESNIEFLENIKFNIKENKILKYDIKKAKRKQKTLNKIKETLKLLNEK